MNHLTGIQEDTDQFENDYCKMAIKEGVIYCTFAPFLEITLKVAVSMVSDRIKFSKRKSYPMFTDISNLKYINREAREFLAGKEGIRQLSACAYLASTQHERFLWEMFLKINRPAVPSRIFTDKKDAITWLEQFK